MSHSQPRAALRAVLRAAFAVAAFATVASAQPPGGMQERQRQMQAMLFEGITLTDAQKKSVDSVQTAYADKMQAAPREERMAMRQEQQKAVRALLTAEQQKTYDANMEKMRANRPQRPGGNR